MSYNLITLNCTELPKQTYEQQFRTMTHEMGHALGLSHPHWGEDTSNPSQYSKFSSIMWQSSFPKPYAVSFVSYIDRFAIMSLYGK